MNEKINDGGPAFPGQQDTCPDGKWNQTWEPGMSRRDWFAGQALAGLCAAHAHPQSSGYPNEPDQVACISRDSYKLAEGMLAEREKRRKE